MKPGTRDTGPFLQMGVTITRQTRYEMYWQRLWDSPARDRLSPNEKRYVQQRCLGKNITETRETLGWYQYDTWKIQRRLARKFPEFLRPGNQGVTDEERTDNT